MSKNLKDDVLLAIPAYNEEKYIEQIISESQKYMSDILVINDGSCDGTAEIVEGFKDVELIHREENIGYGQTMMDAFGFAYKKDYKWLITIAFDNSQEIPIECRKCNQDFCERLEEAKSSFPKSILANIDLQLRSDCKSFADSATSVISAINKKLGLNNILYVPLSKLSKQPEFFEFASDCLRGAREFAEYYNRALEQHNINAIPELEVSNCIELPFWLFSQDAVRSKLFVRFTNEKEFEIYAGKEELGKIHLDGDLAWQQLRNILISKNYKLRPRAVTLTAFCRLYFADLFLHGIGGQKYEAVTDYILERFFELKKTDFVAATATVNLPLPYKLIKPVLNQSQIKSKLRAMKFNPENFIDKSFCELPAILKLIDEKKNLLKSISSKNINATVKKEIHLRISEYNEKLSAYTKNSISKIQELLQQAENHQRNIEVVNSREYFFGLYPHRKLEEIMQSIIF